MKCLIVDDAALTREVVSAMLHRLHFSVTEADDGDSALIACAAEMPDIVLLDWEMPKLDGMGFLAQLREMPGGSRVRVIMCTARGEVPDIIHALGAGATEYIMKPFTLDILAAKIGMIDVL